MKLILEILGKITLNFLKKKKHFEVSLNGKVSFMGWYLVAYWVLALLG